MVEQPRRRTFGEWAEAYLASRIDFAEQKAKNVGSRLRMILPVLGDRDPAEITSSDI
jgi:hypothetical protein